MKRRKYSQKTKAGKNSFFSVFILSLIILFLAIFLYKINSSTIFNSRASGCFCGDLKCFNGNNFSKAYIEKGSNGKPQCCFGWPTGTLKNVKKGTCDQIYSPTPASVNSDFGTGEGNFPTPTSTVPINNNCQTVSCDSLGLGLVSTKAISKSVVEGITSYYSSNSGCTGTPLSDVVNYCSFSCKLGTLGYGYCKDQSVWQKINENYDPTKDQVKILGSFTDDKCTKSFVCNIQATPTSTPTPTPVIKSKKVIFSNPNSFNVVLVTVYWANGNGISMMSEFGLNTFYPGSSYTLDLTDNPDCQASAPGVENYRGLYVVYRKSGFWNMFSPRSKTEIFPCHEDVFSVDFPFIF